MHKKRVAAEGAEAERKSFGLVGGVCSDCIKGAAHWPPLRAGYPRLFPLQPLIEKRLPFVLLQQHHVCPDGAMVGGIQLKALCHGDVMAQGGHIVGMIEDVVDALTNPGSDSDGMPGRIALHADVSRNLCLGKPRVKRRLICCLGVFEIEIAGKENGDVTVLTLDRFLVC